MFEKIKKILNLKNIIVFLAGFSLMVYFEYLFLNSELIIWNLWLKFYYTEISIVFINSILFWSFLALTFYRLEYFSVKKSVFWFIGWLFWIAVSWCPACSITLASYIWLAWFLSVLPYSWLELKIIAFFLLLYANVSTYKNLEVCKIKN